MKYSFKLSVTLLKAAAQLLQFLLKPRLRLLWVQAVGPESCSAVLCSWVRLLQSQFLSFTLVFLTRFITLLRVSFLISLAERF